MKNIPDLIKARTAELQAVTSEHEADQKAFMAAHEAFMQRRAQRQQTVTHLEGCIAQLQALLPQPKKKK